MAKKATKKCLPDEILEKIKAKFSDDPEIMQYLDNIKTCRKASAYNEHISSCMKGGRSMAECAASWKKKK